MDLVANIACHGVTDRLAARAADLGRGTSFGVSVTDRSPRPEIFPIRRHAWSRRWGTLEILACKQLLPSYVQERLLRKRKCRAIRTNSQWLQVELTKSNWPKH